ncbi:MAG: hypothetical protein AAFN12_12375 [Cyanobacteria bacterium J06560_2]
MGSFNLHTIATSIACASVALVGIVSPALAESRTVWLDDNGQTTVTGYFVQGENIYADCDEDCMDLDLYLYTEMGVLVDSDEAVDSYPIITAPYEGTFSIQVTMPSCTHSAGCSASISSDYGF